MAECLVGILIVTPLALGFRLLFKDKEFIETINDTLDEIGL